MSDIQDLLARLQGQDQQSRKPPSSSAAHPDYHEPSVSSPIYSPEPHGPEPHHASAIMSPNVSSTANTPDPQPAASRTASLLTLLRFNPATSNQASAASRHLATPEEQMTQSVQNIYPRVADPSRETRAVSASDLVASFSRKPSAAQPAQTSHTTSHPTDMKPSTSSGSVQAQDYLLKLLNQTSKQPAARATSPDVRTSNDQSLDASDGQLAGNRSGIEDITPSASNLQSAEQAVSGLAPAPHIFGESETPASTFGIDQQKKSRSSPFTYVNPFDQLSDRSKSASRNGTPKPHGARNPSMNRQNGDRAASASRAANEVAEVVKAELDSALEAPGTAPRDEKDLEETQEAIQEAAQEIEQEIDENGGKDALVEEGMPEPMAEAFNRTVREYAHAPEASPSRTSSSADESRQAPPHDVITYNFPMRPFVSITVKGLEKPNVEIRAGSVLEIARLKKEFDQVDRNLIAASQKFITYAVPKNNGIRAIHQDSGHTQHLFQDVKSRVFNVSICVAKHGSALLDTETILATSVDGNTLWAPLSSPDSPGGRGDSRGMRLVFPPFGVQDDHASAGQIKTRAKPSSRHPEYFAIARGKLIHLFRPHDGTKYVVNRNTRVVAVDEWTKEQNRAVHIGKAGKDFIFSEDDSVIASLDKQGIVKFWDIRKATAEDDFQEIKDPITQFATTQPYQKAWPTSVLFIDKERPYVRGIAQRYLIVGMKQNHTLQLWDLALLKPIQELHLPHNSESDPICKIAYHHKSNTIIVGHPTRNSIYLISVSAPKYNIPALSQAKYLALIAAGSKEIPPPESTAIMNSIREISLGSKGQLRSFEILSEPVSGSPVGTLDGESLFELYVLHSKGITAVGIRQDDMGLDDDGKVKHPVDAASAEVVAIESLRPIPQRSPQSESASDDTARPASSVKSSRESRADQTPSRAQRGGQAGPASTVSSTLARVENKQDAARAAIINGTDKGEKEKSPEKSERKKKKAKREEPQSENVVSKVAIANTTNEATAPSSSTYALAVRGKQELASTTNSQNASSFENLMPESILLGVNDALDVKLDQLYKTFDNDRRVQNASNAARHEAVLKMVGSTVAETTEQLLSKVLQERVQKDILPRLEGAAQSAVERSTANLFTKELNKITSTIPNHVRSSVANAIADLDKRVAKSMAGHVEAQLAKSIREAMNPVFTNLAASTVQQIATEIDRRLGDHLQHVDSRMQNDARKLDQLVGLVGNLTESLAVLTKQQSKMHEEMAKLQQQLAAVSEGAARAGGPSMEPQELIVKEPEDPEIEMITNELNVGKYTEAAIMWLQSANQSELFDRVFIRFGPEFIGQLSPLVALSVSAAITGDLDNNRKDRLDWLEVILANLDPRSQEIVPLLPKIMDVLASRLQGVYMQLNEENPSDPTLRRLSALVRRSRELKQVAVVRHGAPRGSDVEGLPW